MKNDSDIVPLDKMSGGLRFGSGQPIINRQQSESVETEGCPDKQGCDKCGDNAADGSPLCRFCYQKSSSTDKKTSACCQCGKALVDGGHYLCESIISGGKQANLCRDCYNSTNSEHKLESENKYPVSYKQRSARTCYRTVTTPQEEVLHISSPIAHKTSLLTPTNKIVTTPEESQAVDGVSFSCKECYHKLEKKCATLTKHENLLLKCEKCGYENTFRLPVEDIGTQLCDVCGREFSCKSEMDAHVGVHTLINPAIFRQSMDESNQRPAYKRYLDTPISSYPKKIVRGDESGIVTGECVSNVSSSNRTDSGELFSCDKCGMGFSYNRDLSKHIASHGRKLVLCEHCGSQFEFEKELKRHLQNSCCCRENKLLSNTSVTASSLPHYLFGPSLASHVQTVDNDAPGGELFHEPANMSSHAVRNPLHNAEEMHTHLTDSELQPSKVTAEVVSTPLDVRCSPEKITTLAPDLDSDPIETGSIPSPSEEFPLEKTYITLQTVPTIPDNSSVQNENSPSKLGTGSLQTVINPVEITDIASTLPTQTQGIDATLHSTSTTAAHQPNSLTTRSVDVLCQNTDTSIFDNQTVKPLQPVDVSFQSVNLPGQIVNVTPQNLHEVSQSLTTQPVKLPFPCKLCFSGFNSKALLNRHTLLNHTLVSCKKCGSLFSSKVDLDPCIFLRSNFLPFFCDYCGVRVTCRSDLNYFPLPDPPYFPFLCRRCGCQFRQRNDFTVHILQTHSDAIIACQHCSCKFINQEAHNRHKVHCASTPPEDR